MTTTPNFDDLTPPRALAREWDSDILGYHAAARWGARHGYGQARQLWPEPITDRPPTEADGDKDGWIQYLDADGYWRRTKWRSVVKDGDPWCHSPRWQPRQPSLQEQALMALDASSQLDGYRAITAHAEAMIRRALEQAGEGKA